jgi:TIR domain
MPLNEVARRYADNLFWQTFHEAIKRRDEQIPPLRNQYASRGAIASGGYLREESKLLVDTIRITGEAKADSLLKAYQVQGTSFDELACDDVKSEVVKFCSNQQHSAVGAISQTVRQFFGPNDPHLQQAMVEEIVRGVSAIINHLVRKLEIARDEVILDKQRDRKLYAAGMGKMWDVFISHASEDKDFVRPLAEVLQKSGLSVWYDEFALKVGDSLRRKIDEGLAKSRYGIVILSHAFFTKNWPGCHQPSHICRFDLT